MSPDIQTGTHATQKTKKQTSSPKNRRKQVGTQLFLQVHPARYRNLRREATTNRKPSGNNTVPHKSQPTGAFARPRHKYSAQNAGVAGRQKIAKGGDGERTTLNKSVCVFFHSPGQFCQYPAPTNTEALKQKMLKCGREAGFTRYSKNQKARNAVVKTIVQTHPFNYLTRY